MSKVYSERPSRLLAIEDEYTSFCLDEACAYIYAEIEQGKKPTFKKEFKTFSDFYKQYK